MEEMECPRGVKMIYVAGGDPLSTSHHIGLLLGLYERFPIKK